MKTTASTPMERCELCVGRGVRYYYPRPDRTRARNCARCDGRGEVPVGSFNREPPRVAAK